MRPENLYGQKYLTFFIERLSFNDLFAPDQLIFPKLTFCSVSTQVAASCLGGREMRVPSPPSVHDLILKLSPLHSAAILSYKLNSKER